MEESELVVALAVLTGYLEPVDGGTAADLSEARVRLARHLLANGIPAGLPPLDEPLPEALMEELRRIASEVAESIGTPGPGDMPVVVRRASDDLTQNLRFNGREVSRAFGPFADSAGRRFWFEVFERMEFVRCGRGSGSAPFLLANFGSASSGPATEFALARGSVWVRGNVLGRPAITWVGLRVASGTLRVDAPGTLSGGVLAIPIGAEGRLELTLEAPPAPAPVPIGEDGRRARARRPDVVTISIQRTGAGRVAVGPTSLEVYGSRLEFDGTEAVCESDRDAAPAAYLVPLPIESGDLAPADVRSTVLSMAGNARVERAFWALPITMPDNLRELGAAADIGALVVVTGGGLELGWPGLGAGYRADRVAVSAGTALLNVRAARGPGRELAQRFHLWPGATGGRSHVEMRYERPALLHHVSGVRGGAPRELTMVYGAGEAAVSPPVYADGDSVTFAGRDLSVAFVRERDARFVAMRGGNDTGLGERATLALANGLIGMTRPFELALFGSLAAEPNEVDATLRALAIAPATVVMRVGVHGILPMLPDPYAASFDAPDFRRAERKGTVAIRVDWRPPTSPAVRLVLEPVAGHAAQQLLPPGRFGEPDRALEGLHGVYDDLPFGPRLGPLVLLDVSSNADQLGVATAFPERATERPPPLAIEGLELCAPAGSLQILTVPTVQWETVWNEPNALSAPFPATLPSTGDGGPALMRSDSMRLVPIAPLPLSTEIVASPVDRASTFAALFSLPFGIRAATRVSPHDIAAGDVRLRWTEPRFPDLRGAHQLRLESGSDRGLPGAALQTSNGIDSGGVARNVLEPSIDDFFNNRFGPAAPSSAVPVSRIDVSGYGASAISRWTNPNAAVVDVTRVQFDVLVGRTAHEVVQVQALLWPSQAVVVRSVTMHRRGSGRVLRRDSGWQAATPGLFRHPLSQCEFHTGVVQGYFGIREIRDTSQRVTVRDPVTQAVAELVAVYFDCDVAVEGAVRGHREAVVDGQSRRLVPSQRQLGFVQVWPDGAPPPAPLTPGQLAALFNQQGAIGGAIDCEIDIGESGQRMRLAGVRANAAPAPTGPVQFAVEASGSLRLPSAGQWSAVRVRRPLSFLDSPEVEPLDPHRGLPLVRLNGMGASYRFADPRDLLSVANPQMEYGILFASPAHRLLFRQPRIEPGARSVTSLAAPLLADSYGMAASRGLFPRYHDAIPLPSSNYALDVVGEGEFRLRPSPIEFAYTGVREISNSASMRLYVEYAATPFRLTFDSTAQDVTWSYDCGRPAVVAQDGKLGRVASALTLQEGRDKTGLMSMEPELKLGASLDSASKLITVLRKLGFPVRVRVHQTHEDLLVEVKVSTERDVKPRPGSPPSFKKRIDLGIGKYSGEIKLVIRCGSSTGKSGLELEVKGELQQETPIPKVYVGGFIEVKLKFERDHRKNESESEIALAAGCVGSVGGALIPELLEAEVTARRGYIFQVQPDAPDPANRVNLGLIMGLEIRAVVKAPVLGDVLRIEFEWEGRALIQRLELNGVLESQVTIRAIVKAAVTVAVLFLDGEFELETEYQEDIPMIAVAGLAAAIGVGLIPPP